MSQTKKFAIDGGVLKWIALVTMVLDHLSALVLMPYWGVSGSMFDFDNIAAMMDEPGRAGVVLLCYAMRYIGRLAFPIFCFLIVEGLIHTRSRKRYLVRMLALAVVSEWPFDLSVYGRFSMDGQSMIWTLALGMMVCMALDYFEQPDGSLGALGAIGGIATFLVACGAAHIFETNYDATGVALITVLWLLRNSRLKQCIGGALIVAYEITAPLAYLLVYFYNGERGRQMKYFFYVFFPVHLLVLYALRHAIIS